jgi:hypothetical protein
MRRTYSERVSLIEKSREAMLSAVQIFNNPLMTFKSESFIVLSLIAWVYLLHAYFRDKKIEYRYFGGVGKRKRFIRNPDGSIKYWDLKQCISDSQSPIDEDTRNNLNFLIGLRNQVEHKKADGLDSFMSARYQACALNYNHYLKLLHGEKFGLDNNLALSLQFAELNYSQSKIIKDREGLIPKDILSYISGFDSGLTREQIENERYGYRLLFTRVIARRSGQADRVVEFLDPKSPLAKKISKEYWVIKKEKSKLFLVREVLDELGRRGVEINKNEHTSLWKKYDAKNPLKKFGQQIGKAGWFWNDDWVNFLITHFSKTH